MDFAFLFKRDQSKISWIVECQRNQRIHSGSGFFCSFEAPNQRSLGLICFVKKCKILFWNSFGYNNPIEDFFLKKHTLKPQNES